MNIISYDRCQEEKCNQKPHIQKPIPTHRYGDYIILRPDEASCQKLAQLAQKVGIVIQNELPLSNDKVNCYGANDMHLTLAMPLKAMNKLEILGLITCIHPLCKNSITFDVVFRGPNNGGNYNFSFSSPNYSPQFDLRLKNASNLNTLASTIQGFCQGAVVDTSRNEEGTCNPFKAHITLGKITDQEGCKNLHNRAKHYAKGKKALNHLASMSANTMLTNSTLPLCFDRIQILRIDSNGDSVNKTCLVSLELGGDQKIEINNSLPLCMH